ncbi:nocobactin polyketide synthase NbtC [Nocardia beijingensis]
MSSHRLPDGSIPVLLSSHGVESLRAEAAAILAYSDRWPGVTPDRVADMLFRTRSARRHRALAMVRDRAELTDALRAVVAGQPHPAVIGNSAAASARRIGFVFPGQGSQRAGMGKLYYEKSPEFRAAVEECDLMFRELFQLSPLEYLLDDSISDDVLRTVQPALLMQMLGLAAMWQAAGVRPAVTIGHSQGELAAAVVSGVMPLADAVRVVTLRGGLVDTLGEQERTKGRVFSMAVLGIDREECEALLARNSGFAELSVINSAHVLVIGGDRSTVGEVVAELTEQGKFAKEIRVAYPAHTSVVSEFRDEFCDSTLVDKLDSAQFAATDIECIGGTLGAAITPDLPVGDYWYWNLRNRVRFDLAIAAGVDSGVDTFIEISEHPALVLALMENLGTATTQRDFQVIGTSRRTAEGLEDFTRNLATVAVNDAGYDWSALRVDSEEGVRLPLLDFPNTRMNEKPLWAPYERTESVVRPPAEAPTAPPVRVRETWVRLPARTLVPPRTVAIVDATGRCVELAGELRAAAARHGVTVVDHDGGSVAFDTVLVLAPAPSDGEIDSAVTALAEFAGGSGWLPDLTGVGDAWLVTVGGEQVLAADTPDLFGAAAQAGFRCLAAEHLGVNFRHLDLPAGQPAAALARQAIGAIHTAGEPELALREDGVYAKRLIADDSAPDPLRDDRLAEVLITGGTGKLGLDFCEQFVRAGAKRITLLGRSDGSPAVRARIARIGELGPAEIVVRACDVRDEAAVAALAADYRDTPIDLIVHAAVDYAAAAESGREAVRAAAAPKILALDHLVRHLPRGEAGRIVVCSSLSATIGGRGHLLYSAVNRMLDAAAARYRGRGVACSSVQWGLWREVGADQAEALAKISGTGLAPMDPVAATAAGITTAAENVIVAAADWERIADIFTIFGFGPLFASLEVEPLPELPHPVVPETQVAPPQPEPALAPEPEDVPEPGGADTAERVRFALRAVMGMDTSESIDGSMPLVALGLDSLQALDLRKRIEAELRRELPVTAILGGASLDEVVTLLG